MSSIEEFWIKNNLSELDDETAQKIAEEFHDKPEDFTDIIEAFRDVEEYSSLIMSKILEINSEALNQLIDITVEEKLHKIIDILNETVLDSDHVGAIIEKAKENKEAIVDVIQAVVYTRPKYPIVPVAEETVERFAEDEYVSSSILGVIPKEKHTEKMIDAAVNKCGKFVFDLISQENQKKYGDKINAVNNMLYEWHKKGKLQTPEEFIETIKKVNDSKVRLPDTYDKLLSYTSNKAMSDEAIDFFFHSRFKGKSEEDISKIIGKYKFFRKNNSEINKGIELDLLLPEYDFIPREVLLRVMVDPYATRVPFSIKNDLKRNYHRKLITHILKKKKGSIISYLNGIFGENKYSEFMYLFSNNTSELDEADLDRLIGIVTSPRNFFNIKSIEDLRDYERIKKKKCFEVLSLDPKKDEEKYKLEAWGFDVDPKDLKKAAILHVLYNIDYKSAENLVKKYGMDIDKLKIKDEEDKKAVSFIKGIDSIMRLSEEQVDKALSDEGFRELLEKCDSSTLPTKIDVEDRCIGLYTEQFRETVFDVNDSKFKKSENGFTYKGKKIDKYEIPSGAEDYDFSMVVRVEGAYSNWEAPDSYKDYLNRPHINSHGNCQSFINQSLLAIARPSEGPIVGYSKFGNIEIMGPWDLDSVNENSNVDIRSAKWKRTGPLFTGEEYVSRGIQYRLPKELVDNTRHNHNEVVTDRLIYNEDTGEVDRQMPSYVLLFKEHSDDDFSKFEDEIFSKLPSEEQEALQTDKKRYDESLRLADELGIPIVVIDREEIAKREMQKIQKNISEMSNNEKDRNQLIRDTIVRFENNRCSVRFSELLKDKYYTDDDRKDMIEGIINAIENGSPNLDEKRKSYAVLKMALQDEYDKQTTITGQTIRCEEYPGIYLDTAARIDTILSTRDENGIPLDDGSVGNSAFPDDR